MDFSESTVKGWARKGFRLMGSNDGEIDTSRGRHNTLSGYNVMELMLTIHLVRDYGLDLYLAHHAAMKFSHTGGEAVNSDLFIKKFGRNADRDPSHLFNVQGVQNNVGTLLLIDPQAKFNSDRDAISASRIYPYITGVNDSHVDLRFALQSSPNGVLSIELDGLIMRFRTMLGLDHYPEGSK